MGTVYFGLIMSLVQMVFTKCVSWRNHCLG